MSRSRRWCVCISYCPVVDTHGLGTEQLMGDRLGREQHGNDDWHGGASNKQAFLPESCLDVQTPA